MVPYLRTICLTLVWAITAFAEDPIEQFSFGHQAPLSPNSFAIPGWSMLGEGHVPQLLSDKVILTPPYGGNKRGALWSESANSLQDWMVQFKFRAGAPDRGGGNLQLWYAANGEKQVGTSTIYTAGTWEGLAIVVDTVSGTQKVRGFLNDGSVDYKSHANVDGLAFGHCDHAYRNLGRPSLITIKSTQNGGIDVRIDGRHCFSTNKVVLPTGYNFGMVASSFDPPDSFEVFQFSLAPTTPTPPLPPPSTPDRNQHEQPVEDQQQSQLGSDSQSSSSAFSDAQMMDMHNRLNQLSKSIQNLFLELQRQTAAAEQRHNDLVSKLPNGGLISSLDSRVSNLDRMIGNLERELKSSDHNTQFRKLSEQLTQTHQGVTEHVPERLREYVQAHTPRIGFILYSFMAFQTCCIGVFAWFKWRKSTMPKKYL
ncbi:hypothetical protein B0A52_09202 [Exophiala mesophila]|uniref:L-type lectin-like domain-containing protein n=1 Tax=Exophiala mesophila TaxID=212818 RepID=A0A438MTM3_EXOME|nr:hypothetical protein B0A52_09202 [Exophiala mesophila]